jgi:hypothetical protein
LDDDRYGRLEQRAAETGRSVAAIIREAIDEKLSDPGGSARRREAAQALLGARIPDGQREPDWADVKNDLRDRTPADT